MTDVPVPHVPAHDIRALWQTMPTTPLVVTAEDMRRKVASLRGHIRRRNLVEYAAWAIGAVGFAAFACFPFGWVLRVSCLAMIVGVFVAADGWRRRMGALPSVAATSVGGLIDFQRRELTRQRDALASAWRWYMTPLLPGFCLLMFALWNGMGSLPDPHRAAVGRVILVALAFAAVAVGVMVTLYQLLGAARFQRQIDELERYAEGR